MSSDIYLKYWGKASKEDGSYHLLPYHCLDVAAVGEVFLRQNNSIHQVLAKMLALDDGALIRFVRFFLGLHDIGKFARHFQVLRPDIYSSLEGDEIELPYVRHDILGEVLWREYLRPYCVEQRLLGVIGVRRNIPDTAADYWMHAVLGHHGKPVSHTDKSVREVLSVYFPESVKTAVKTYLHDWLALCGITSEAPLPSVERMQKASWWLAGLAVLCDWLGSNKNNFPYNAEAMPLDQYWQRALEQAEQAIHDAGMIPAQIAPRQNPEALFGDDFRQLTPLQKYCRSLDIYSGSGLYLLEDVTGAGKTEAALILAHRLMVEQGQRGIYFALPSMATANAMYERMGRVYRHLYTDKSTPSLVLAHGARRLHRGFRDTIENYPKARQDTYGDGTESAQFRCAAWLADSPKKSLLAEVGVGTIDQAVLGVLPSRHQSLRLFGLLGKVLIIDEVHAFDEYLFRLLTALITFHAASGGSTILLSATLPHAQRQKLLAAYYHGTGHTVKNIQRIDKADYPLLTYANTGLQDEIVLPSRKEVCRRVEVKHIDNLEQAEALMREAVSGGQCICWIRNTVHDARRAYREFKALHPEWQIELFHARYVLGDRLDIETRVVQRFGKTGGEAERRARILIATPVVEQSLDIDFDHMISDLAPLDLIIQRAGRLHRHRRDMAGNVIDQADQRPAPVIHLFAPGPVDEPDKNWFKDFLPKAAYVYPNHARLWLGLRLLIQAGGFTMPGDARTLIEGVYGDVNFPSGLEASAMDDWATRSSEGSLADYNALSIDTHYGETAVGRWWSEERTPTRLGDSTTVYLARVVGEEIVPLRQEGDFPWQLSSLSMLTHRISAAQKPAAMSDTQWQQTLEQLPAQGKWGVLLLLDADMAGSAINAKGEQVPVSYSPEWGLLVGEQCKE